MGYHRTTFDSDGKKRFSPDSPLHLLIEEIVKRFGDVVTDYELVIPTDNVYGVLKKTKPDDVSGPDCISNFTGTIGLLECEVALICHCQLKPSFFMQFL